MALKVKLNRAGVRSLLRSSAMSADLEARARRIAAAAGAGFEVTTTTGPTRARAEVTTATFEARHAEASDRALTRAIDAGRST